MQVHSTVTTIEDLYLTTIGRIKHSIHYTTMLWYIIYQEEDRSIFKKLKWRMPKSERMHLS